MGEMDLCTMCMVNTVQEFLLDARDCDTAENRSRYYYVIELHDTNQTRKPTHTDDRLRLREIWQKI